MRRLQMTFKGILEQGEIGIRIYWVRVPFRPPEVWPNRIGLKVKGTVKLAGASKSARSPDKEAALRTSLMGSKESGYVLVVNRKMQQTLGASIGSLLEVSIEPDLEERPATAPPELTKLLKQDRALKKWFEALNESSRKYIVDQVAASKSAEVRERRAELWIERMMLTIEGESAPPPVLQAAFRKQPIARMGWDALTPLQRRSHLLSIFMLEGIDARARRVERAIEAAIVAAKKKGMTRKPQDEED
jgi:uncharacterized protein YdeI (YjbR/CyaY-like superfamily)